MAETDDPKASGAPKPDPASDRAARDHDDDIGFASPASLTGRAVASQAPDAFPALSAEEDEPDLFDPPAPRAAFPPVPPAAPAPAPPAPPAPTPTRPDPFERSFEAPARPDPKPGFSRAEAPQPAPMSLYAVYVLILLAVPTLGVAAVIALVAMLGREAPAGPLAASHFVYQQRTLWIAAVAAVLGAVLVVVNVGVFVLFVLAVWIIARGAYGVLKLNAGRPVPNPRGWLF